jgi:hypothetical protein
MSISCTDVHDALNAAQAAAAACDAAELLKCNQRVEEVMRDFAASKEDRAGLSTLQLHQLQEHVEAYARLCAALGHTLRTALMQASLTDEPRYEALGNSAVRTRNLVGGYG